MWGCLQQADSAAPCFNMLRERWMPARPSHLTLLPYSFQVWLSAPGITCVSLFSSVFELVSSGFACLFLLHMCHLSGLSGVRAHTALIKVLQLSIIHGKVLFFFLGGLFWVFYFLFPPPPVSDSGQLLPPRPHVVGDALAYLGTVVKVSLAHWSGLPARQLVAAESGGETKEGRTQVRFSWSSSFLLCVFSRWKNNQGFEKRKNTELSFKNDSDLQPLSYHLLWPDVEVDIKQIYWIEKKVDKHA